MALTPLMQAAIKSYGLGSMFIMTGALQAALIPTAMVFEKMKTSHNIASKDDKNVSWWNPLNKLSGSKSFLLFLLSHCK